LLLSTYLQSEAPNLVNIQHSYKHCWHQQHSCHLEHLKIFDLMGSTWELVMHSYITKMLYSLSMVMYIHQIVLRICLKSNRKLKTKREKQTSNYFLIIQSKGNASGELFTFPEHLSSLPDLFVGFVLLILWSLFVL
jgi:hypothetical protein